MKKEIVGRIQIIALYMFKKVLGTPRLYFEALYLLVAVRGTNKRLIFCFNAEVFQGKN